MAEVVPRVLNHGGILTPIRGNEKYVTRHCRSRRDATTAYGVWDSNQAMATRFQSTKDFQTGILIGERFQRPVSKRPLPGREAASCLCTLSTASKIEEESLISFPGTDKKDTTVRHLILKPPLSDTDLVERFLQSPQLQLRSFPLLSSCLPLKPFAEADQNWIEEFLPEAKNALGLDPELVEPQQDSPASHFDSLLYLAFQHKFSERGKSKWIGVGHSRLWFLGQYVLDQALCELFLQIFPRDRVGPIRERVFNLTSKKVLPYWIRQASMDRLVFPAETAKDIKGDDKVTAYKTVFWALVAAVYLTLGMPEVYRLLFEVFGMDLDAPTAQPRERKALPDEDSLSPDLEAVKSWKDVVSYVPPEDALFPAPLIFRACVPPGMHRFRGNAWEVAHLPAVGDILGYPLEVPGSPPELTKARNLELDLGLQLAFLHPSKFKGDHPRFCLDRLEYLGTKIKSLLGAEELLMKHLDGPAVWLIKKHRLRFMNRISGRTFRDRKLHLHIAYSDERRDQYERNRRLRNFASTSVQHALHGLGYVVYGRSEVRRLMSEVFSVEEIIPAKFL